MYYPGLSLAELSFTGAWHRWNAKRPRPGQPEALCDNWACLSLLDLEFFESEYRPVRGSGFHAPLARPLRLDPL